uniref:Uncharacterized protein n=1 Tax=viral metagenome TaxID=1070528 RepID=A0A2V0R982_9ZZZZ
MALSTIQWLRSYKSRSNDNLRVVTGQLNDGMMIVVRTQHAPQAPPEGDLNIFHSSDVLDIQECEEGLAPDMELNEVGFHDHTVSIGRAMAYMGANRAWLEQLS